MHLEFNKMMFLAALFACVAVLGAPVAKKVHPSSFAASKTIDVSALLSASENLKVVPDHATYPMSIKNHTDTSTIHSDWASFQDGAAFVFKADMDTDCDGIDYKCKGNADGQPLTNWGSLSAYEVPFIVIPQKFLEANPVAIPGNNVAAVICNNRMFYAILGDTNGNNPQVTGEGSWLLARSCFPQDNLSGSKGHEEKDVTYVLFSGPEAVLPPDALNEHYITDFAKFRSMGNHLTSSLSMNLGIPLLKPKPGSEPHGDGEDDPESPIDYDDDASDALHPGPPPPGSGAASEPDDFDPGASAASNTQAPEVLALFVAVFLLCVLV